MKKNTNVVTSWAGISETKINSKSSIIECGIACNSDISCNGFIHEEIACSKFKVWNFYPKTHWNPNKLFIQLDFAILHYDGSDKLAIYLEKQMVLPSLLTPDEGYRDI